MALVMATQLEMGLHLIGEIELLLILRLDLMIEGK